jgi:hypothetical protein
MISNIYLDLYRRIYRYQFRRLRRGRVGSFVFAIFALAFPQFLLLLAADIVVFDMLGAPPIAERMGPIVFSALALVFAFTFNYLLLSEELPAAGSNIEDPSEGWAGTLLAFGYYVVSFVVAFGSVIFFTSR